MPFDAQVRSIKEKSDINKGVHEQKTQKRTPATEMKDEKEKTKKKTHQDRQIYIFQSCDLRF